MGTSIEWCDEVWNPITGCTPISEGCAKCYAKRMANRLRGRYGYPKILPFRVTYHHDRLPMPLRWRKPRRIFVNSMGDLFHEDVEDYFLDQVFGVVAACERNERLGHHIFQVLTKRPERMGEYFSAPDLRQRLACVGAAMMEDGDNVHDAILYEKGPLLNLWLGVTAENQKSADERLPLLLQTPAAVRFVSVEPMLGPVDLEVVPCHACNHPGNIVIAWNNNGRCSGCDGRQFVWPDWVICGAETGSGARPMEICAATHLRDSCLEAEVPFFFKKDSKKSPLLEGRRWNQFPIV